MQVRRLIGSGGVLALLLLGLVATSGAAAAAPIQLLLPQGAAFSILGASCGGIQEQAFTTGFDPSSGYPDGDVYLQTKCGGSGRGGGYHTTTYSAWVSATWDFTGTPVSTATLATAPTGLDPGFSAYDSNGNEIYNSASEAFLSLAPDFVPPPRVTGISATMGPASGGTSVTITGTGLADATAVWFGATQASSFSVAGDTSITAVSPVAPADTVDVTVVSPGGSSTPSGIDQFTFVAAPVITGVDPSSGPISGGTSVTITGTGFTNVTQVTFGGTATGFTVDNDTTITAVSPVGETAESVTVAVASIGGTSPRGPADQFTYTPGTGCGSSCLSSVQCSKVTGTLSGSITLAKCSPKSSADKIATSPALGGTLTWSSSGQTTVLDLNDPTSPGQGGCKSGTSELDLSGVVVGGNATVTSVGDDVSAQLCLSNSGHLALLKGTTFSL